MNRAALQRSAIRRIMSALAAALSAHEIRQIVVEEAARLTDAGSAALCLLVEGRDQLDFVAVAGENADQIQGLRIRVSDSLSESVLATGTPSLIDSRHLLKTGDLFGGGPPPASDSRPIPAVSPFGGRFSIRSAAVAPVIHQGRLIGTLMAQNKAGSLPPSATLFDQDDIDSLAMLADFAGLSQSIEQAATTSCEQQRELAVLYDAAQTVAGNLNVQEVIECVLSALCKHIEYHSAVLFLFNDERTHLFIAAERGLSEDERDNQLPVEAGIHVNCLDTGQARLIPDTEFADDYFDISESSRALCAMIAPIKSRNEVHGLLQVTSLQRHAYRESDLKLLEAVALQAGSAIENAWLYEEAQRQAEQSAALYDLSQHVNSTLNLESVLDFVADSVVNLLKVDEFALLLNDPRQERLIPRISRGINSDAFQAIHPRAGEGIAGWVYEWQTPQAVSDVAADPRNRTAPLEPFGIASLLCVPLHVGDEVIGVVLAMTSRRRLFTVGEMELLYTICNQASVAIYNALQFKEARARTHEMSRYFRRIAHALGSSLDGQDLPQMLADLAIEIMRADRCTVYRVDEEDLRLCASSRFRAAFSPDNVISVGQGLTGWVARRGQSLTLNCLADDPRSQVHEWLQHEHLCSYLAVPLKAGRRTVGVIEIFTQQPRDFTKEEVQLLSTFARRTRVAEKMIENSA